MHIGLTGGIGSGKSTVAAMLVRHGASLVDTDAIARQLTQPAGAALSAVRRAFGASAIGPDGSLDRAAMRSIVFADATAKKRLEEILHPMIGAEAARHLRELLAGTRTAVAMVQIPLVAPTAFSTMFAGRCVWQVSGPDAHEVAVAAHCQHRQLGVGQLGPDGGGDGPAVQLVQHVAAGVVGKLAGLADAGDHEHA